MNSEPTIKALIRTIPQVGKIEWIGLRPDRNSLMKSVSQAKVIKGSGLEGDRFTGNSSKKREITLIQQEHLTERLGQKVINYIYQLVAI